MKRSKPEPLKPLKQVKWVCARCGRPVRLVGSPPERCEACKWSAITDGQAKQLPGDTFISPELMEKHLPRDGEVQA